MDWFFGFNLLLLVAVISGGYWQRWLQVRGPGSATVVEFGFYAVVLMAFVLALWRWLRGHPLPARLLVLMEAGAMTHFVGSVSDNLRDLAANASGLLLFLGLARTRTPLLP